MQGWDNTGGCYVANNSCSVQPCYYLDGNQTQNGHMEIPNTIPYTVLICSLLILLSLISKNMTKDKVKGYTFVPVEF